MNIINKYIYTYIFILKSYMPTTTASLYAKSIKTIKYTKTLPDIRLYCT